LALTTLIVGVVKKPAKCGLFFGRLGGRRSVRAHPKGNRLQAGQPTGLSPLTPLLQHMHQLLARTIRTFPDGCKFLPHFNQQTEPLTGGQYLAETGTLIATPSP
jgi:hypothetical protein